MQCFSARGLFLALILLFCSSQSLAHKLDTHGGITLIGQAGRDSRVRPGITASVDLELTLQRGRGEWFLWLEGSTTVQPWQTSAILVETNADARTTLTRKNKGRLQVSNFGYSFPLWRHTVSIGLLDASSILDSSRIANDETRQFVSTTLVNNPVIGFPDYTLGMLIRKKSGHQRLGYTMFLGLGHGLRDTPERSYRALFDLDAREKGVFAALEIDGKKHLSRLDLHYHFGLWSNTAAHRYLSQTGSAANYGLYTVLETKLGRLDLSSRLGVANRRVAQAAEFVSLALRYRRGRNTIGLGASWTGLSGHGRQPGQGDRLQAELYYRHDFNKHFSVTPSIQWVQNSSFDSSNALFDQDQVIVGIRLQAAF